MYLTRAGIVVFSAAVLAGPWYAVGGYSAVGNLISELADQNTRNNFVMVVGFLALGLCIVADGIRQRDRGAIPFIAFGLFMALAGLFGHKPIDAIVPYSEFAHKAHSVLASLAGVSITLALIWQALRVPTLGIRVITLSVAVLCVALPLAMLQFPAYQGLIQRFMYLFVFAWLWAGFPAHTPNRVARGF